MTMRLSVVLVLLCLASSMAFMHPKGTGANIFVKPATIETNNECRHNNNNQTTTRTFFLKHNSSYWVDTSTDHSVNVNDSSGCNDRTAVPTSAPAPSDSLTECEAVARGKGVTNLPVVRFHATLTLRLVNNTVDIMRRVQEYAQTNIATDMVGCSLLKKSWIRNVRFTVFNKTAENSCTNCTDIRIHADIYYNGTSAALGRYFYETIMSHCSSMASLEGVVDTWDPCRNMTVTNSNGTTIGEESNNNKTEPPDNVELSSDDSAGTTNATDGKNDTAVSEGAQGDYHRTSRGSMAVTFSAVALVLAFLLANHWRHNRVGLKHHELVDEGDDTYLKSVDRMSSRSSRDDAFAWKDDNTMEETTTLDSEFISTSYSSLFSSQMRVVSVVGDSVSVASTWSGVGNKQRGLPSKYQGRLGISNVSLTQDVHPCASSLCRVCQARQRSLYFIPASMPGHSYEGLSTHSRRTYVSHDTVQL